MEIRLNKQQRQKLYNCHIGVGIVAFKSAENELQEFEFYTDAKNRIRFITNALHSPEVNINEYIISNCYFESEE